MYTRSKKTKNKHVQETQKIMMNDSVGLRDGSPHGGQVVEMFIFLIQCLTLNFGIIIHVDNYTEVLRFDSNNIDKNLALSCH